ncbi:MAG: AAA family ATPase [Candidatus Omnitrophica bacterium]|nr:AAA family ATPase [Candidatus Omnitrophota bacterium]
MSYYKVIGFEREPFSTSPDPEFFYESKAHEIALTNLMIEMRLRRGLSVILGDVGTGKTTLSRKLIQLLRSKEDFIFNIVLDPAFESEELFLTKLAHNFELSVPSNPTILDLQEALERFLYQKGVEEGKTVVLIVDEAQKLNEVTLEALRVLLNYETNEFKLLQLILLGQLELYAKIMNMNNFLDRISFRYTLNPLDEEETRRLIEFRIRQAGYSSRMFLFLDGAIREIHRYTKGYPRQIAMLCHKALKALVLKRKSVIDEALIKEVIEEEDKKGWSKTIPILAQRSSF